MLLKCYNMSDSACEAVCVHRIGDCLIALEVPNDARESDDYMASTCATAATYSPAAMRSLPGRFVALILLHSKL